jgi:HTH-type transcriptional regulator/antitoxin HigA
MTISKPIRTKKEYEGALLEVEGLLNAPAGSAEADKLELLSILLEAYEEEHHPIGPADPIEAIKFRMEQGGLSRKDLEPYIGSRARVSEVLNRRRRPSVEMIRRLHSGLGIPAEVLLRPYPLKKNRTRIVEKSR